MALEVKELVVKFSIEENSNENTNSDQIKNIDELKSSIVKLAVEKTLEIIEQNNDR